ncbi:MAG: hypothetical protein A2Y22_03370 [Clostridiales bacterium GWD2_32_59]|nr:MAG: hypothetical protein A2Y22_03370 [Clostridiales bacterium GWD2_32_59]
MRGQCYTESFSTTKDKHHGNWYNLIAAAMENTKKGVMFVINSLSHAKWECKYHVVFIPKYRKQTIMEIQQIQNILGKRLFCNNSRS